MFFLIACAFLLLFLPFILLAGRPSAEEAKLRARFAMLHRSRSQAATPEQQTLLLKEVAEGPRWFRTAALTRLSKVLQLKSLLIRAGTGQTATRFLRMCGMFTVAASCLAFVSTRSGFVAALSGVLAGMVPWLHLRIRASQRTAAMEKALPQVLDMISRALRAGHSLVAALEVVAEEAAEPARSAFGEVFQKQKFGLPLRDALLELVHCFPSADLKVLVTAILVQRDTGGNLVQILERTSAVIRERLKLQGDVRVHTAQGRMTGWILCLLPVLMLGMLLVTNPSYPKVLLDDPFGRKLMWGGVALLGLGAFLIQRIVKQIEV